MTPIDETSDSNTHIAGFGKYCRYIFVYWVTTLAVATLITTLFVMFMGLVREWVS